MIKNRKKVEAFILKYIEKLLPKSGNYELYKNLFKEMNNKEFHSFMERLRKGDLILQIIAPNEAKQKLSVVRNMKVAKELGVDFFQQVYDVDKGTGLEYLTPQKNMVYHLPIRRTRQTLLKGISVAADSKKRNPITNQVTGDSKGGKITFPEIQVLHGLGMKDSLLELMSVRGGNLTQANARRAYIHKYGKVSRKDLDALGGLTGATASLDAIFKAAHIKMKGI